MKLKASTEVVTKDFESVKRFGIGAVSIGNINPAERSTLNLDPCKQCQTRGAIAT